MARGRTAAGWFGHDFGQRAADAVTYGWLWFGTTSAVSGVVGAALRRPRPAQVALLSVTPLLLLLAAMAQAWGGLAGLALLAVTLAHLVVPASLRWEAPSAPWARWSRWAVPATVLAACLLLALAWPLFGPVLLVLALPAAIAGVALARALVVGSGAGAGETADEAGQASRWSRIAGRVTVGVALAQTSAACVGVCAGTVYLVACAVESVHRPSSLAPLGVALGLVLVVLCLMAAGGFFVIARALRRSYDHYRYVFAATQVVLAGFLFRTAELTPWRWHVAVWGLLTAAVAIGGTAFRPGRAA